MADNYKEEQATFDALRPDLNVAEGFPQTPSPPFASTEKILTPEDHSVESIKAIKAIRLTDDQFFTLDPKLHLTRDVNDPNLTNVQSYLVHRTVNPTTDEVLNTDKTPVFSGSTTLVNPLDDPVKQEILDSEMAYYEEQEGRHKISPIAPFIRSEPTISHRAMMFSYNRTRIPVADVEWRKGFRHLFFTRPECYVMCQDNGIKLCSQAENDEDFASTYTRLPHVIQMLAPVYVTGSFDNDRLISNWHYLLSNRIDGFNPTGTTIGINENTGKSTRGYTITPGTFINSNIGSTFEATFNETKNLECYETLRLWMMYISKRHSGMFAPSYNGYLYDNNFYDPGKITGAGKILHPYDRAIDYAATLFDIVTNESGTKVLYWCKYYGIFPVSATPSLSNSNNGPITGVKTSATFRYMFKVENTNKALLEFNYNAGIVGKTGKLNPAGETIASEINETLPFLLKDEASDKYIGAAGMFTGSPYIVMGPDYQTDLLSGNTLTVPYLRFANINNRSVNKEMNQDIVNNNSNIQLNPISL